MHFVNGIKSITPTRPIESLIKEANEIHDAGLIKSYDEALSLVIKVNGRREFLREIEARGCSWYETQMLMFAYEAHALANKEQTSLFAKDV